MFEKSKPKSDPAAAPMALVETARIVVEDGIDATLRGTEAATRVGDVTFDPATTPGDVSVATPPASTKGSFDMATAFDTTAFTPTPDKVQALFGDFQTRAKTGLEKGAKIVEDFGDFTRGNVEAIVESGRAAAKGAEAFGQDAASYGRRSLEEATTAFKGFAAAKSPTELFKLQSDYAKTSFEAAMAEGSRLSEAWLKLVGEIAQPLSTRVAVAAEKIKTPAV